MDNEIRAFVLVPSNDLYNEFLDKIMGKDTFMGIDAPGIIACISIDGGLDTFRGWCKKVIGTDEITSAPYSIGGRDYYLTADTNSFDTDDGIPSAIKEPSGTALTVGNIVITKCTDGCDESSLTDDDVRNLLNNVATYHSKDGDSTTFRAVSVHAGNKRYEKD